VAGGGDPARADGTDGLVAATRAVVIILLVGLAARLLLAATLGLGVDESYEVVSARALSASYFDHPPLSFWMAGVMARLTGGEHRLLLRMPFVLTFAGTSWLMFRLTTRLFGARAGRHAVLLLNVSPVFSLAAGGWILPDGPLDAALVAAALALAHVVLDPPAERAWRWWLLGGVAAGVALLSKYHAVFLFAGVLAYLTTRREARVWLRRREPYLALAVALVCFAPVLLWNARHGWASFRFQGGRAAPVTGHPMAALLQNVGGQAGYLLPWIWLPLVWQLPRAWRAGPGDGARWFLGCLAVGPIAVFTLLSLGGRPGLPHWPAPGYLFLFPLLGAALVDWEHRGQRGRRQVRWALATGVALFVVLTSVAATDVATGWIARAAPPLFRRGDPSLESLDWTDLRGGLAERGLLGTSAPVVAATNWIDAAKIGYALGPDVPVLCLSDDPRGFQYLYPVAVRVGREVLVLVRISTRTAPDHTLAALAPHFASITREGEVPVRRAGREVFKVAVYRATGMHGYPTAPRR
jgi:4-amino-4-deoxy-L-arabinose transferase-like glycosyltransferase